jgi:plastocyanin
MPINLAPVGWLAGALALGLLVVGSAGAAVIRRQHRRPAAVAADGPDMVSAPAPSLALQRVAFSGPVEVQIQNFAFEPAEARVTVGTTITWTNRDLVPHTVTLRNGMADSGILRPRQTFSYTFASPGAFEYYCRVHPSMVGTVVVVARDAE